MSGITFLSVTGECVCVCTRVCTHKNSNMEFFSSPFTPFLGNTYIILHIGEAKLQKSLIPKPCPLL